MPAYAEDVQMATCEVVFGGQRLDEGFRSLAVSAAVDLAVGKPGMFTLEMEGYGEGQSVDWMEVAMFALGTEVRVKMGYQGNLRWLFSGEVMGLNLSFTAAQAPRLTVRAYDLSHRMTRGEKRRAFVKQKLSDIAQTIVSEAGLTPIVTGTDDTHEYVEQRGLSDMAFLLKLAEEINYHFFVICGDLYFQPALRDASPTLRLGLDDDTLIDFQANLSLAQRVNEVVVRGWDVAKAAMIEGHARSGEEASKMGGEKTASQLVKPMATSLISDHPVATEGEAHKLAHARLDKESLNFIEASGSTLGSPLMLPGEIIEIKGASKWFSGLYCLTGATHRYDFAGGYTTNFSARRNSV